MKTWEKKLYCCFSMTKLLVTIFYISGAFIIVTLLSMPIFVSSAKAQKLDQGAVSKRDSIKNQSDISRNSKIKFKKGKRGKRGRRGPAKVIVDLVTEGTAIETVQVYGRVIAQQKGIIAARTRGAVEAVKVRVGDRVKKGDIIVKLISSALIAERDLKSAELKEFTAKIRTVGVQLALAKQELKRLQRLRKSSAFSLARYQDKLRDVERSQSALIEAKARREQAKARLRIANINLTNAKILAPFNGVIISRAVEVGDYVSLGAAVVTILNENSFEIEAEVPANRLGGLNNGRVIDVKPEFGRPFKASVRAIVPQENALSRTRVVRLLPNFVKPNLTIASNQSVVLHIPSGASKKALTVHKDAITQRRGKRVVFVVKETKGGLRAQMRTVKLGEAFGLRFEVLKGLKSGEQVVIRGNERLRPRQRIKINKPDERRKLGKWRGKRSEAKESHEERQKRKKDSKPGEYGNNNRATKKESRDGI